MIKKFCLLLGRISLIFLLGSGLFQQQPANGSRAVLQAPGSESDVRAFNVSPAALVTLTFDDSSPTVYDQAFPILAARGLPGTFYFISSALTPEWRTRLNDLEDQGWEIGSHSVTHRDLTTLSESELVEELTQSKADLQAAGLEISGFAYPEGSGAKDGRVLRRAKAVYQYGRAVTAGYNRPIVNQYALRAQSQVASTSLETMKSWVDEAVASRQWLIILLHSVDDSGELYSITPQDLSDLADYIHTKIEAGSLQAVTTREGLARQTQPGWLPIARTADYEGGDLILTNGRLLWHFANQQVVDYLFDGYEWVESGRVHYWEWHGQYRHASTLAEVTLKRFTPNRSTVQFTLTDSLPDGFSVVSSMSLGRERPVAEVQVLAAGGTPESVMLGKMLNRRFSTLAGALVTDSWFEQGQRNYGASALPFIAFEQRTDLLRVVSQAATKFHSEYASLLQGEFRLREIDPLAELPYTWCTGGLPFTTVDLAVEAENSLLHGACSYYEGEDASPGIAATGVVLDASGEMLTLQFTPPWPGNYNLSIRQLGLTPGAALSWQLDGGAVHTTAAAVSSFGYSSLALPGLTAETHSLSLSHASGTVVVDYALLVPVSRSPATPLEVIFPGDLYCNLPTFFPLALQRP